MEIREDQPETAAVEEESAPPPGEVRRWRFAPLALLVAGVLVVWGSAWTAHLWSAWQLGVTLGGLIALASLFWLRQRVDAREAELAEREAALREENRRAREQQEVFERQLLRRERSLAQRLHTYHEWMEFPQPIDLDREPPGDSALTDAELEELARRDRALQQLLEAESQSLYEKVRNNEFQVEGRFQPLLLRDELYELARKVARIYQPGVEQPLLETSMENILRALSRVSLQLLVVLDGLPLNVKRYNLQSMYGYIRQAVVAFGVYKSAAPFLPYVNAAWMAGRVALGANPLTLGAWWLAREVGMRGAKKIAGKLADQQALALLQTVVRVVGYEVAAMYAGDFRRRDANWVYGVELVELVSRFPPSRESLSQGLREIGAVQLRGEYDRIFLYRCLAAHRSAEPARYRAAVCLTLEERRAIAARLEKFFAAYIHGRTAERVNAWRAAVEQRLDLRLQLDSHQLNPNPDSTASHALEREEALRSLASFLVAARQREPEELPHLLAGVRTAKGLPPEEARALIENLSADPPYFFTQAELEPRGPVAAEYVDDLLDLALLPPLDPAAESLALEAAAYLRVDREELRKKFDLAYLERVRARLPAGAPSRKLPGWGARAVLAALEPEERLQFVYHQVAWDGPNPGAPSPDSCCLLGTNRRVVLLAYRGEEPPALLWRADATAAASRRGGLVGSDCRLTGGAWLLDPPPAAGIRLIGPRVGSSQAHFQPLLDILGKGEEPAVE